MTEAKNEQANNEFSGDKERRRPRVVAVNLSETKGVPKEPVANGELIVGFGLKGDAHGGNWHRQVSLLARESIDRMTSSGVPGLSPGKFAENITTKDIVLHTLPVGTLLTIGEAVLEVTQIGKECHGKCAVYRQVGECVMPNEGIFARVVKGGTIHASDEIRIAASTLN